MARQRWTLMVVPEDHAAVRQFRFSRKAVQVVVVGALVIVSSLALFSAGFFLRESDGLRARRLAEEKRLLAAEVEQMREQMKVLDSALEELSQRDEQFRLAAGLEPIDRDVQQAGIGGPGTRTLRSSELWRLDPELGREAFATAYDLSGMIRRALVLDASWQEAIAKVEDQRDRWERLPSIWPTRGYVSSEFMQSRWHPLLHRPRPHEGMDISAPRGTPIIATARGTVTFVGPRAQYGNAVEIDHGDGIATFYAHASRTIVDKGQVVERGEKIAEVGDTGLTTGANLHYEVLVDGRPQNPRKYILDREIAP